MLNDEPDIENKILNAVDKYKLNSAAYTEGVIRGVMDNLLFKVTKITKKKDESGMKNSHCPKNF